MKLTITTLGPRGAAVVRPVAGYLTVIPNVPRTRPAGYRTRTYVVRLYATGSAYRPNAAPTVYVVTGPGLTGTVAYRRAVRAYLRAYRAANGYAYPAGAGYVGYANRVAATATTANYLY